MKKILSIFLVAIHCFLLLNFNVSAVDTSKKYLETIGQINFQDLKIAILNDEKILVDISENNGVFKFFESKTDEEKLLEFIEKYPDEEKNILNAIKSGEELVAIGYTEAPLVFKDDHFERIPAEGSRSITNTAEGQPSNGTNFVLVTRVFRTDEVNSAGEYTYKVESEGRWTGNSWVGGEGYPDSGRDYIVLAVPTSMTISSDALRVLYPYPIPLDTYNYFGRPGYEYFREYATSNVVKYGYLDDPLGPNQVNEFTLFTTLKSKPKSTTRTIHTHYRHTWSEITFDLQIQASTARELSVILDPHEEDNFWPVCSSVSFNF